jgi:hypothetical protein
VLFATDAGGVGLNLQRAASACINIELPWNPAVLEQRIGRIYRLGQHRPIDVYNLVSEPGIESRIADLVGSKRALFSGLFDGTTDEVVFERAGTFLSTSSWHSESRVPGPRIPTLGLPTRLLHEETGFPDFDGDNRADSWERVLVPRRWNAIHGLTCLSTPSSLERCASMPSTRLLRLATIAALLTSSCSGTMHDDSPDSIIITPSVGYSSDPVPVVITGTGFLVKATQSQGGGAPTIDARQRAWLGTKDGKKELNGVTWLAATTLNATVPSGVEPGTYDLTVENALGRQGTRKAAYTVLDTPPFSATAAVDRSSVSVGQPFTLAVTVTNSGSGEVTDFKLGTPAVTSSDGGSASPGVAPSDVPSKIGAGEQRTFRWTLTPTHVGSISITVSATGVDSVTGKTLTSELAAPVAVIITQFSVTAVVDHPSVNVGQTLTLTATVANSGSGEVTDFKLGTPVLSSSDGGSASPSAAPSDVPSRIGAGERRTFGWTFTPNHAGNVSITVSATGVDFVTGKTVAAALATPVAVVITASAPVFSVAAIVDHPSVDVGQTFTLTATVANGGSGAITDFELGTPVLSSSDGGSASTGATPSHVPSIGAGEQRSFSWTFTSNHAGNISITLSATGVDSVTGKTVTAALAAPVAVVVHAPASTSQATVAIPPWDDDSGIGHMTVAQSGGRAALTETGAGDHYLRYQLADMPTLNQHYTMSARVQAGSCSTPWLQIQTYGTRFAQVTFDLSSGTAGSGTDGATGAISSAGGGEYDIAASGVFVTASATPPSGQPYFLAIGCGATGAATPGVALYVENTVGFVMDASGGATPALSR